MKIAVTTDTHWGFSRSGNRANLEMNEHIKKENPDLILHCGDDNSSAYCEKVEYWKLMRETFPSTPIGIVNGNHSLWDNGDRTVNLDPPYVEPFTPADIIQQNMAVWKKNDITYIPDGMEFPDTKVFVTGADCWYHMDVNTNDKRYIPRYYFPEGRDWLLKRMYAQFMKAIEDIKEYKEKGYTTILITHFGVVKEAAEVDYKADPDPRWRRWGTEKEYFGADPALESLMGDVDYYFYGHSHSFFEETALNGHTKVINVGSDYEFPRVEFLEV